MPYSLKLLLIGLFSIFIGMVLFVLAPFDRTGRLASLPTTLWSWAILKICGIRLKVQGLERLDPNRPYIFIANHQSYIDIPVLIQALPSFQLRWIAKKELLWVPLFGWAIWSAKHIIVDRSNLSKAKASLKKAEQRIKAGVSVVLFPEGTRGSNGGLLPFKRGGFVLAIKARTPIVPVTVSGAGTILPPGDWRIRKGEIKVIVSEPVEVDRYQIGKVKELLTRVREQVESHGLRSSQCNTDHPIDDHPLVPLPDRVWE